MNQSQNILAYDVRYNTYRCPNDPQFRTLYIRRRSQLLRENAKKEKDPSFRQSYLHIRRQLLAKKYGPIHLTESIRSHSLGFRSRSSSIVASIDNLHIGSYEGSGSADRLSGHRRYNSSSSRNVYASYLNMHDAANELEGVVPTKKASASRAMAGNTTLSENYAFGGMFHLFDQHADAVTAVKFGHNARDLLACSSKDGTLSVCVLSTQPPSVKCMLHGHKAAVNDFDWSISNDFLVSASSDMTAQVWESSTGQNVRVLKDSFGSPVMSCRFMPLNNNFIVIGNEKGHAQVFNMSTGKCTKGGIAKGTAKILCMEFDPTGSILWSGDVKGCIMSYLFDERSGKLLKGRRLVVSENCPVTCISSRTWVSREARDPSLLVNCACNSLLLFSISGLKGDLQQKTSFKTVHEKHNIRSAFCPLMSFRQGACVVTGSEDATVYFYNIDEPQKPINTLLGHSSPVLGVCWNYDESLLASCDMEGTVIVWKRQQQVK